MRSVERQERPRQSLEIIIEAMGCALCDVYNRMLQDDPTGLAAKMRRINEEARVTG